VDRRVVYQSPTPYDEARIHAAAVYCSDGRVGDQLDEFLHHGLGLPRYDRLACPGGPSSLSGRFLAFWEGQGVEQQLRFLHRVHALRQVILIAHEGCAYYQVRLGFPAADVEREQRTDLERAAKAVIGIDGALEVRAFFALRRESRIAFEAVPV